jgi:hypothetical protein
VLEERTAQAHHRELGGGGGAATLPGGGGGDVELGVMGHRGWSAATTLTTDGPGGVRRCGEWARGVGGAGEEVEQRKGRSGGWRGRRSQQMGHVACSGRGHARDPLCNSATLHEIYF